MSSRDAWGTHITDNTIAKKENTTIWQHYSWIPWVPKASHCFSLRMIQMPSPYPHVSSLECCISVFCVWRSVCQSALVSSSHFSSLVCMHTIICNAIFATLDCWAHISLAVTYSIIHFRILLRTCICSDLQSFSWRCLESRPEDLCHNWKCRNTWRSRTRFDQFDSNRYPYYLAKLFHDTSDVEYSLGSECWQLDLGATWYIRHHPSATRRTIPWRGVPSTCSSCKHSSKECDE